MNKTEYFAMADELAREAGAFDGPHQLFVMQRERLWMTLSHFQLWDVKDKNVLEVGAFYGYTPFVLNRNGNKVTVIEGDDPITYPLQPLYARRGIQVIFSDLVASFGEPDVKKHRLPFPDNHFDLIVCWETMEHFSFNPVGFVKELRRVLKPGGTATLTVPNRAKLEHRLRMAIGRPSGEPVETYFTYYAHPVRFFGWHWREYTMNEFIELFSRENFRIQSAGYLTVFMNRPERNYLRDASRAMTRLVSRLIPSCGSICALAVGK